jgi:hypothetical protein
VIERIERTTTTELPIDVKLTLHEAAGWRDVSTPYLANGWRRRVFPVGKPVVSDASVSPICCVAGRNAIERWRH